MYLGLKKRFLGDGEVVRNQPGQDFRNFEVSFQKDLEEKISRLTYDVTSVYIQLLHKKYK